MLVHQRVDFGDDDYTWLVGDDDYITNGKS